MKSKTCATCLFMVPGLYQAQLCNNPEAIAYRRDVSKKNVCPDWACARKHTGELKVEAAE